MVVVYTNLKLEKQESVDLFAFILFFVKAMPHPVTGLKLNRVIARKRSNFRFLEPRTKLKNKP